MLQSFSIRLAWIFLWLFQSLSCTSKQQAFVPVGTISFDRSITSQYIVLQDFIIQIKSEGLQVNIRHSADTNQLLWSSIPGKSMLMATAAEARFEDKRGTFILHEKTGRYPFLHQHIRSLHLDNNSLTAKGFLKNEKGDSISFRMDWSVTPEGHLSWKCTSDSQKVNRLMAQWLAYEDEFITGMGEQPSHFNLKGQRVPVLVQEQGIGRGDIRSLPVRLVLGPSTGNSLTTYKAVPFYISSVGQAFMLENDAYSEFDFSRKDITQIKVFDTHISGRILPGKTPADFIESYTLYAGRMRKLPDWAHSGAIIGMQGGTEKVYEVWRKLQATGTPIAAFWLQDWVGQRKTILGKQLWWNWELDDQHYPNWSQLRDSLSSRDIAVMGYINPFIVDVEGEKPYFKRNLYQEALDSGFLVLDHRNEPYLNVTSFKAALLDLSHPGCRLWIKKVIREELIGNGFRGWMADFGEALPFDVHLKNVSTTASYHNLYAQDWAQLNKEAIDEAGLGEDITFFSRSAYTRSPAYSTLFWQGDQMVDWGKNDGLPSALTGLITGGMSGFSLNHSDIGGYASVDFPLTKKIIRSPELLNRWMQLSAFTVVFRSHEGVGPDKNHQVYSDSATAKTFAYWAKVHQAWKFYRDTLLVEANAKGLPVVRSMAMVFPDLKDAWTYSDRQMMVGNELLVVPVLTPDTDSIAVYLPPGVWVNAWTNAVIRSKGEVLQMNGYTDRPGLFYQQGSVIGERFATNLSGIR